MNEKYLQTARLGEGVIYVGAVRNERKYHAAVIIKQHNETCVDLMVFFADGTQERVTSVTYDVMAERECSWAARPRT